MKSFFFKHLFKIYHYIILIILLGIISSFFTLLKPIFFAALVNETTILVGINDKNPSSDNENSSFFNFNNIGERVKEFIYNFFEISASNINSFIFLAILILIISIIAIFFNYLGALINAYCRYKALSDVRADLYKKLLLLGLPFFNNQKAGELISRLTNDTLAFVQGLVSVPHHLFQTSIMIIFYSFYLISTNLQLTLYILAVFIINQILSLFLKEPVKKREIEVLDQQGNVSTSLQESFSNIKLIKSYAKENLSIKILSNLFKLNSKSLFKAASFQIMEPNIRNLFNAIAEIFIVLVCVFKLIDGSLTLEGFVLYIYISRLLLQPIAEISTQLLWIQRIRAAFNSLGLYINTPITIKDGDKKITSFEKKINIENVSFNFKKESILQDVKIEIFKGQSVAIVGSSGSGKSTIIDLILRLYDPKNGNINLDDKNIKNLKIADYRKLFGVVNQENYLFNDTIENNIRFGDYALDFEEVVESAKKANAHEFIQRLPAKYKTVIGDRGVKLSGGQKQRLSIARALLNNPPIIILDEATSSLDNYSEGSVIKAINVIMQTKTTIIVAHRLSTFINANRIFLIDKGKIVDSGTHKYLSENNSLYKKLYI